MPRRERGGVRSRIEAAEGRYAKYQRELKELLYRSERYGHDGNWRESANTLQAMLSDTAALIGVCWELNLLYQMIEED